MRIIYSSEQIMDFLSHLLVFFFFFFRDVAMKALNATGQNHISMDSLYEVYEQIHFGCLLLS